MRILFLNHNVVRKGGTFYRAFQIARVLASWGHDVVLMSISPKRFLGFERETCDGVEIIHTPDLFWGIGRSGWDPWDIMWRIFYLHNRQWDIVHAWDCRPAVILPALYARHQSRSKNGKLIIDWCDWWGRGGTQKERSGGIAKLLYNPVETYFEEAFRIKADGTTVISEALYERAINLGVSSNFMRIVPQGCDFEVGQKSDRYESRRKLGLPLEHPLIISVGALMPSDAILLFNTINLLFKKIPTCRMILIGKHGASIPQNMIENKNFHETGFIPDETLIDYMVACDLLVVPLADNLSNRARWPSKVNPFLSMGRSVLITRVGDLPQMLEKEDAAMIVDCDPNHIADSIINLLSNLDLRRRYETNAQRVAQKILAWPKVVGQLEDLYSQVKENLNNVSKLL